MLKRCFKETKKRKPPAQFPIADLGPFAQTAGQQPQAEPVKRPKVPELPTQATEAGDNAMVDNDDNW